MPYPEDPIVLSFVQAETLLQAYKSSQASATISPNLGLTTVTVDLADEGVAFPFWERISWSQVEKIKESKVTCFRVDTTGIHPIQVFSEATNRMCSLMPTMHTPTMLILWSCGHRSL